ncbi:MAG: HAD-IA family hydrolase [Chloroflexi bacterium]|nr:HAD-IA family hydrolase [Chloroflexota bacterium]
MIEPAARPLSAVLLDVDGTLVDTAGILIRSLRFSLETHLGGTYPDEQLRDLLGRPLRKQMEHFSPERAAELSETFLRYYEEHQSEEQPFREALALLPWLRERGLKVCLVTSKTAPEMVITGGRFPGLRNVDAVVTSDETSHVKPHPDPALLALRKLGVTAAESVMIGDSPYDIECAHSAGVTAGSALWGPFPRTMLEPFHPDHWFDTPSDVQRFVLESRLTGE